MNLEATTDSTKIGRAGTPARGRASLLPRTAAALAVLAFALYLPGFWWGVPRATSPQFTHSWGVDAPMPLGPLADIHNIVDPQPDRSLGYPLMHSFIVAAAYTPYLGFLWLTGRLTGFSGTYPFGLVDPVGALARLTLIAHSVSVLMGAGIVVAAYDAAQALWDRRTGILAAVFAMVSYPMFYYSRTGNVDVPTLFFTALALAATARIMAWGFTRRRAAWLGLCVGLALGTKEPSFASFLAVPFVLLALHWRSSKRAAGWFSWAFWQAPLVALLAAALAFGAGSGLFVDPERYFAHVAFASQRLQILAAGNIAYLQIFPYTWAGHLQLAALTGRYLSDAMTWPGVALASLGCLWTLRREPLAAAFGLPALTYLLILFWSARAAQLRYVMPAAFTLAFFEARAVVLAWESRRSAVRAAFALLAFGIVGVSLLRGVDLTYAMINDSRFAAGTWLESRTEAGSRVETFGPIPNMPPLKAGVIAAQAVRFFGSTSLYRTDQEAAQQVVDGWRERNPQLIIIMPDYTSLPGVPYSASCPPQIYAGLLDGTLGYRQAAFFETPPLLPWVRRPALDYPTVNPPIRIFVPATAES